MIYPVNLLRSVTLSQGRADNPHALTLSFPSVIREGTRQHVLLSDICCFYQQGPKVILSTRYGLTHSIEMNQLDLDNRLKVLSSLDLLMESYNTTMIAAEDLIKLFNESRRIA